MNDDPGQRDFDDLSAWLDGELEARHAERIKALSGSQPHLREAADELRRLDGLLAGYTAPAPPAGLADRIIARARREGRRRSVVRVIQWLLPAAAAAAILIVLALHMNRPAATPTENPNIANVPNHQVPQKDAISAQVAQASFFGDFYVLENYDTLEAIEQLEAQRGPNGS